MKNRLARIGILLLISLALAVALEALQLWSQPREYKSEPRVVQEAVSLDFSQAELTNAAVDGETLKTKGEGSVILFRFQQPETLSHLTIESKKHIHNTLLIRIFLSRDGATFSDSDIIELEAVPESVTWTADFPEDRYAAVRIETDGKLSIRTINCRDAVTEQVAVPEHPRLWRIALLTAGLFVVLLVLRWFHAGLRIRNCIRNSGAFLKENLRKLPLRLLFFFVAGAIGYIIIRWLVNGNLSGSVVFPLQLFFLSAGAAFAFLVTFPKTLGAKPEKLFVVFCLLTGCLMVFIFPNNASVNWDAEYHYEQALRYSYLGENRFTAPDSAFIQLTADEGINYNWEARKVYQQAMDEGYMNGVSTPEDPGLMLNSIYEVFAGTGLFVGRVLHLPWNWILYLGKLFNLLTYTACGYFAIRRLKSGKMILACVLLIPTNVLLASCFSYDPGVTAFLALSLSYFFAEWQEPDRKLTWNHAFVILASAAVALLTKAFYAPALLFTLIMPRGKWAVTKEESSRFVSRKRYLLLVISVLLISLIPYILPLFQGVVSSSMRGDTSTHPVEMLRHIGEDPLGWFRLLFNFQKKLFSPAWSSGLLTNFSYQGAGPYWQVLYALLVLLAFTDKKDADRPLEKKWNIRIAGLLLLYLSTCIICFCLYITFTAIESDTINGVQLRYLSPFVFPVLMLAGSGLVAKLIRIDRNWKQQLFNRIAFAVSLFMLYSTIFSTNICKF